MSASRLKPSTKRHNANISMAYGCTKDNNTYCYRLTNGHKHLHRIILGYGWEHTPFDVTKLSCYEPKEGEETMTKGRKAKEKPSNDELMAFAKKWDYANLTGRAKTEYHVGYDTAKKWLTEAGLLAKQTPEPEQAESLKCSGCGGPTYFTGVETEGRKLYCTSCVLRMERQTSEPGGGQPDPVQENQEPAEEIMTQGATAETLEKCEECGINGIGPNLRKWITPEGKETCYECFLKSIKSSHQDYSVEPLTYGFKHFNVEPENAQYAPADNDYNDEPQRTTMTRAQYDAMAMNDDRMSALAIFCENQAVEQLRQDWAVDIFKHSRLSRERKLELIGQLLDWRAE